MAATENYRTNTTVSLLSSTLDRVAMLARNGSLAEILREVEAAQDKQAAITTAESDSEIDDVLSGLLVLDGGSLVAQTTTYTN